MAKQKQETEKLEDLNIKKNAAKMLFGENVQSLIIKKGKVIGVETKEFKIFSKNLNMILDDILETPHDKLKSFISQLRTKEIYGFETIIKD